MRVLVGCECSGMVRNAFRALGHDAWSCDLLPADDFSQYHKHCDLLSVLGEGWDLGIFHPPCDYLTVSGNKWFRDDAVAGPRILTGAARRKAQADAVEFVKTLYNSPIPRVAIENPVGRLSTLWRKPDQIIQPYNFGDWYQKATCLWLKNLLLLKHTHSYTIGLQATVNARPSPERKQIRSITYPGIAKAMAEQWGLLI